MRFKYWIIKATNTNTDTEYVILIALPRQQWFRERDLESLGNSRETLISIFIIWVEILAQGLLNVGQASYPFEATCDELTFLTPNDDYSGRTAPLTSKC